MIPIQLPPGVVERMMYWDSLFTYDDESGNLIWKARPVSHFARPQDCRTWNTRFVGRVAGAEARYEDGKPKCVNVAIGRRKYKAHRIIFEMEGIAIPNGCVVDHIDYNPHNNRRANLRIASHMDNHLNAPAPSHNTSGFKGVTFKKDKNRWRARVRIGGKYVHVGYFAKKQDAVDACRTSTIKHQGEFARP